jgi:hypothetical protein
MIRMIHKGILPPLSYLRLQMKLEGMEASEDCFIRQVEPVPGEEFPLVLLAQFANRARITYYAEGLTPDLQKKLSARRQCRNSKPTPKISGWVY